MTSVESNNVNAKGVLNLFWDKSFTISVGQEITKPKALGVKISIIRYYFKARPYFKLDI